jgi:glycyl-tRNA synthetase beta chain
MGGIYAREDGRPEEVWKAIYFHYLPVGVEATAPPTKEQLGKAAVSWAAVSLADKLDTVVSMFAAGERPTGSRDPYGLRRAAQGIVRVLVDLPELTGLDLRLTLADLVTEEPDEVFWSFMADRVRFVLEQRGYDPRNVRAVTHGDPATVSPLVAKRKLETLPSSPSRTSSSSSQVSSSACATSRRTSNLLRRIWAVSLPSRLRSNWQEKSIAFGPGRGRGGIGRRISAGVRRSGEGGSGGSEVLR